MCDMPTYLVFDIGCIECGEESGIIGFTNNPEEAGLLADSARVRQADAWCGEHQMIVLETRDRSVYAEE